MPRTKSKREESATTPKGAATLEPNSDVLTLSEAAAYLKMAEADVLRWVEEQALPARRLGNEWRFLKSAIQQWLATGTPTWETRKAAILELAGKYRDDSDLEQIVAEAYRQRGRPTGEEASLKGFKN
jgi:excisionase family DNA binding protein